MRDHPGVALRAALRERPIIPFIGVYDLFSASLAARRFDAIFASGFGFAASHYGLPDIGFIAWPDMVDHVRRIRAILPDVHLLVDIDDGYVDVDTACHVVRLLEDAGASGVVLEDQQRPRRCGHVDGKQILPLPDYLTKLGRVLDTRRDLVVVARTDASLPEEILTRVRAFGEAGADVVLADGLPDLTLLRTVADSVTVPVAFNQIAGGKSPSCSLAELQTNGARLVIYSTPALFAAQGAIEAALDRLDVEGGRLPEPDDGGGSIAACMQVLQENLARSNRSA